MSKRRDRRRRQNRPTFWRDRLRDLHDGPYTSANRATIDACVVGELGTGARVVVNISAAHVPAFCAASARGEPSPYKNTYDLQVLGVGKGPSQTRLRVDAALPVGPGVQARDVYFCAVELSGTGIRFYGDICFVLRPDRTQAATVILEGNSYELERQPLLGAIHAAADPDVTRRYFADHMAGAWSRDRGGMLASKVFQVLGERHRRFTLGQIAEAARSDEDYVEVLRIGSFGAGDLEEARIHAADAALEANISSRLNGWPTPGIPELLWRDRRRRAEEELRRLGVSCRTVTSLGRTKDS